MLKKMLLDLYVRVIVAKKTTLIGLGIVAADVVVQDMLASSNSIVHAIAAVAGALLTFYKGQAQLPEKPAPVDITPVM